ncbi:MAG: ABC transporter ATP-binding protein [Eggerthellales bacterium]|nr:ABC transporter ATP-binding protein [Eggerthellales bacterium]
MAEQTNRRRPHGHGHGRHLMPDEKAKDFKGTLRKIIAYLGAYKIALVFVVIFALGGTIFNIIGPKVLSQATTELFTGLVAKVNGTGGINFDAILSILLVTLAIYCVSALCSLVQSWVMSGVTQRISYKMRQDIAEKINRMPFGFFDKNSLGDTLSRITNDVDTLGMSLNQSLTQMITSVATIIGVLVMMLSINVVMTLVTLLLLPISGCLIVFFVKRSQKHFVAQQNLLGEVNGVVEEAISGHTIVKAFNRQEETIKNFDESNERLYNAARQSLFISSFMKPIMDFIGNVGYVAVAILGSVFAVQGIITVGDIQAFIQYVKNFTQPLSQLTQISTVIQQLAASAERIFEFLAEDEEPLETYEATPDRGDGVIEFDHVKFGYESDKIVINDFSTVVEKGQTVALVGPTGAGKTTIVKLLMRFYDVTEGSIRIGGRDLREFNRADIRNRFGMVLQDTWLFSGSIRENIRYGRLDATDEEVEAAAKAGCAHHFIQTLPGGYDFVINEDASNISQGQRQLLTIARAILANRDILILDEATSSVDTRTEEHIQRAMDTLMEGRTSFVIAHRLSTIRNADLILVVNKGDIIEQGTHEELLALNGFYADLYNSQFADCDDSVEPA